MNPRLGLLVSLCALALLPRPALARHGGVLVVDEGPAVTLSAPAGWVVDRWSGAGDGLPAVIYREGGSWATSSVAMYVRSTKRHEGESMGDFIRADLAQLRAESPGIRFGQAKSTPSSHAKTTVALEFSHDRWGNFETVVYLGGTDGFVTVVLTARDRTAQKSATKALAQVVKSLRFAEDDDDLRPFIAAYRAARANGASTDGKRFDEQVGDLLSGPRLPSLRGCASDAGDGEHAPLDLLLRVKDDGSVEDVLARPDSKLASCLRDSLLQTRFSRPPRADFWVRVALTVKP